MCCRMSSLLIVAVAFSLLMPTSLAKTTLEEKAQDVFYRVPSTRSKGRIPRKGGCASFGHSCFGGHGKRSEVSPEGTAPLIQVPSFDPMDYEALQFFRQLCTLQPQQYLRMAPIFRRLAETYTTEVEEPLPRK